MPKLGKIRLDENRQLIEQAALTLFTKQGFNGTNIRDIAEAAGVSTGMIYTYYPSKEALFTSLVHSREAAMSILRVEMFRDLEEPFSAKGLKVLANSIRTIVYDNSDYWRLMYIDVVEFDNHHFAETFHDLPEQFRQRLGGSLGTVTKDKRWCGEDPGFAYATIYLHLFTYFLVEKLFRGNQHMGVDDEQAMDRTVNLLCNGLWRGEAERGPGNIPRKRGAGKKAEVKAGKVRGTEKKRTLRKDSTKRGER
jgi:AcrR family transcriptional regulator